VVKRRNFLQLAAVAGASSIGGKRLRALSALAAPPVLLSEFGYRDVELAPGLQKMQFEETQAVLMGLSEDSLLKPFRLRAGMPAPGADLGGWYDEFAGYDYRHGIDHGFAPASSFGQWISALARGYAATGAEDKRAKVERLLEGYSKTIGPGFYQHFRFPAYTYDKLVQGLIDAHQFCAQQDAFSILDRTTDAALPICHRGHWTADRRCAPCRTILCFREMSLSVGMSPTPCRRICSSPTRVEREKSIAISQCVT